MNTEDSSVFRYSHSLKMTNYILICWFFKNYYSNSQAFSNSFTERLFYYNKSKGSTAPKMGLQWHDKDGIL